MKGKWRDTEEKMNVWSWNEALEEAFLWQALFMKW
jgi:hypothetical protein